MRILKATRQWPGDKSLVHDQGQAGGDDVYILDLDAAQKVLDVAAKVRAVLDDTVTVITTFYEEGYQFLSEQGAQLVQRRPTSQELSLDPTLQWKQITVCAILPEEPSEELLEELATLEHLALQREEADREAQKRAEQERFRGIIRKSEGCVVRQTTPGEL